MSHPANIPTLVLGQRLVGEKMQFSENRVLLVELLLGEGGFSYVYLVSDVLPLSGAVSDTSAEQQQDNNNNNQNNNNNNAANNKWVLKVTAVQNQEQREIAQKEAMLLRNLSHPSIVQLLDAKTSIASSSQKMQQHMLLMEHMSEGHAFSVISAMSQNHQRFSLSNLILAFGQICNAVSYLHAQKPPIVHRDLKLENFLVGPGQRYKLCDFGSAVIGHVSLLTSGERSQAEMVVQKTTTQMYRAPEMVDLYMCPKLTQATDVWALGCCLFAMAFFKNCFDAEGVSINLAILSGNYKIPHDSPYGDDLSDLIRRMLTLDSEQRADMREVIKGLSAVYAGKPLQQPQPQQQNQQQQNQQQQQPHVRYADQQHNSINNNNSTYNNFVHNKDKREERFGIFRTDGQGQISQMAAIQVKPVAKKLDPNSAAARRKADRSGKNNKVGITTAPGGSAVECSKNTSSSSTINDTVVFSQPAALESSSSSPNRPQRQQQQQQQHQPKFSGSNNLQTPVRLKKIESCSGTSQASSITSEISKEFEDLDEESFCFDDYKKDNGNDIFSATKNPFAYGASLNDCNNNNNDSTDDPFNFDEISSLNNINNSILNNSGSKQTTITASRISTNANRIFSRLFVGGQQQTSIAFNEFCETLVDSGEDNDTKQSALDSSTKASSSTFNKKMALMSTTSNKQLVEDDFDPNDISLTFSI